MTTALAFQPGATERDQIPPFVPHPCLRNGHVQTIAGRFLPGPRLEIPSTYHEVEVGDGDTVSVLETVPDGWTRGGPSALLIHGLGGCARAPYITRLCQRLRRIGALVIRMNLRGAGSGFGLARGTYHAGRTDDIRRVVEWMEHRHPASPVALVGFSLGANLVLKLAAEAARTTLDPVDCVLAANPPVDLAESCRHIARGSNRIYDRNFVKQLRRDVARLHAEFPELSPAALPEALTLFGFDEAYTAPRNGFSGAEEYYRLSSSAPLIPEIKLPGLVIHARDDPFIPAEPFERIAFPSRLALELIDWGGHLGYISREPWGGDRRWLDARLAAWLARHWEVV